MLLEGWPPAARDAGGRTMCKRPSPALKVPRLFSVPRAVAVLLPLLPQGRVHAGACVSCCRRRDADVGPICHHLHRRLQVRTPALRCRVQPGLFCLQPACFKDREGGKQVAALPPFAAVQGALCQTAAPYLLEMLRASVCCSNSCRSLTCSSLSALPTSPLTHTLTCCVRAAL